MFGGVDYGVAPGDANAVADKDDFGGGVGRREIFRYDQMEYLG